MVPDADTVNSVSNITASGLLALIILYLFWQVPKAIAAYREEQAEDRKQRADDQALSRAQQVELLKGIQVDRHDDRDSRHADNMMWAVEIKEQRLADEARWERVLAQMGEDRKAASADRQLIAEALHRVEESNRNIAKNTDNLALAIREIGKAHT